MSKTVDERVVSMQFDNKNFESNVSQSMSTLEKLKSKLNFKGASKGLENISDAAKKVDVSGIGTAAEAVSVKFSSLQVIATTALANITNSAINAGKNIVKALTIDPVMTGFQEYETQINAVQTILANTQSKGSTIDDVNKALDELNTYADQTIYNFTEMTKNIGTFTAAGVDLDKSVTSIKGIANLAAVSGSTATQASTAMYQLSQALAAGRVSLMDWNSVVNAGMGGEVFQTALKRTAEHFGYNVDGMIKKYGSFRESLTQGGWLTAEVLTETLTQLSGAYSEADLIAQGYTKEQAKEISELAKTALGAATDVKTFTQLFDTMKEAVQSGWTQSWEIIVGDFEEAKSLLSEVSNVFNTMVTESANARNEVLQGWKDLGGRTALIDSFRNVFEGIGSIAKPIGEAFRDIFPPITAERLYAFTKGLEELTSKLKISDKTSENLKRTFKGLFSILDIGKKAITAVPNPLGDFLFGGSIGSIGGSLLELAASIGDIFTNLNKGLETGSGFSVISDAIGGVLGVVSDAISAITGGVGNLSDVIGNIGTIISDAFGKVKSVVEGVVGWFRDNIDSSDIFAGLAGGGIFLFLKNIAGLFGKVKKLLKGGIKGLLFGDSDDDADSIVDKFSGILDGVHSSLSSFTTGLNVASLVGIAAAITMLSSSLRTISEIKPAQITYSVAAIAVMMGVLNRGFKTMSKTLVKFNAKGTIRAGITMMAMAKAIDILASAMTKLSSLSWSGIIKGLAGVGGSLLALSGAFRIISKSGAVNLRSSLAILAIAKACSMLADAVTDFSSLSWSEIARGLTAMGGALLELSGTLAIMSKVGGFKSLAGSVGLLIAVQSLDEISENLERLGGLSWAEIGKGLAAMGGALLEFTAVLGVLSKVGGFGSILGGIALLIAVQSLDEISENLERLGNLSWEQIGKGLSAMGGALLELSVAAGALGKLAGLSGIVGGTSIVITVQALDEISENLERLGQMSWEEIGKGLAAMGGALAEVSVAAGGLGALAGLSGIIGGTSIVITVQALDEIAEALQQLGLMSWEEIGKGLAAMGGALAETGLAAGLTGLAGLSGLLGGGAILITVQGLMDIAEALLKFGSMSWDEIGRGLVAMAGALAVTGLSSALTGFAGLAGIIGGGSILLVSEGLMDIALALQEFGSMSWDEIGRGLTAMGAALGETALGGLLNTLSGLGAASISTMAVPLGQLADSVQKWAGVSVPEGLGTQLATLADGVGKFTFGGFGAGAIATVAEPLGTLATSVNKWSNVTVPENIGDQLSSLADGVKSFTWAFMGGFSIGTVAEPLGQLATSVNKWKGVSVPEGIGDKLSDLATGIKSFSFAFLGGWSIGASVEPLGQLADAVSKWKGVTVPEGMKDSLTNLSDGINSFSIFSDWKIDDIAEPLSAMADAVLKWNSVTVPEGLADDLQEIANGIDAFGITSDWGISDIAEPLGNLGDALKKWNGIYISSSIGETLPTLAEGLKSLRGISLSSFANDTFTTALTNIKNLISTINSMGSINTTAISTFSSTISSLGQVSMNGLVSSLSSASAQVSTAISGLMQTITSSLIMGSVTVSSSASTVGKNIGMGIATGLQLGVSGITFTISGVISSISSSLTSQAAAFKSAGVSMGTSLASGITASVASIPSKVKGSISGVANSVKGQSSAFRSAGVSLINALNSGFSSSKGKIVSTANSNITAAVNAIRSKISAFSSAGKSCMSALVSGLKAGGAAARSTVSSIVSSAASGARSAYSSFYSAGAYVARGFANGISANMYSAVAKARAMASQAASAARAALNINSPSKVFYQIGDFAGQGFVNALDDYGRLSYKAAGSMADYAKKGLTRAISKVGDLLENGIDSQPTIRPVLDLSDVESGTGALRGMFADSDLTIGASANIRAISAMMRQNGQNGANDDVISALSKLRRDLGKIQANNYNINGITYDDGTNVAQAVQTLVRAARIERRA